MMTRFYATLFALAAALCTTASAFAFAPSHRVTRVPPHLNHHASHKKPLPPLFMGAEETDATTPATSKLPFWLDPGTKGGAVFLSLVLFIAPIIVYNVMINFFGADEIEAGITIGVGFTVILTLGWVSSYLFRVATKDMTYVSAMTTNAASRRYLSVPWRTWCWILLLRIGVDGKTHGLLLSFVPYGSSYYCT
jgi:hypothetical protein